MGMNDSACVAAEDRGVPCSIEAEQSVLGALLLDNGAWDGIADLLRPADFYRYDHRVIFEHIGTLIASARPADVVTVYESLATAGKSDAIGGLAYLNAIAQSTPSAARARYYAESVRDRSRKRSAIVAARALEDDARNSRDTAGVIVERAQARLEQLAEGAVSSDEVESAATAVRAFLERLDRQVNGADLPLSTGLLDLDEKLGGGFNEGELIVVAGRPAMGKTALLMRLALAAQERGRALVFSLEMSPEQLGRRLVAELGSVSMGRLKKPDEVSGEEWSHIAMATEKSLDLRISIDCRPNLALAGIRARARQELRRHGKLSAILIDYLQLLQLGEGDNLARSIGEVTRGLKILARELGVPIILLSQLNRGLEQRPNKRPVLSDLRESGAIEQDADVVLGIYRDEVYNPNSMDRGIAEILVLKQRQGEIGTVGVRYDGHLTRFSDLAHGMQFGRAREATEKPSRIRARGFD